MGKASGIAWTALAAEAILSGVKFIGDANGAAVSLGVIPLTIAIVALVAVVIVATDW